jgi:phage-related protein
VADLSLVFDLLARDRASEPVKKVGDAMKDSGDQADGFGDKVKGMFGSIAALAGGAGLAVGASFVSALEAEGATRMTTAQLGLDPAESAAVGKMAGDLFAGNYGDSLETVNGAIGSVASSISGLGPIGSEAMQGATRDALNFASAFDVDVAEATQTVGQLITSGLVPDARAGFDLLTASFQRVPAAMREELPDILNEYGTNFRALGFNGEQAFALLTKASQGGAVVLDKTGDALKEFTIRGSDMSTTSVAAFQAVGLNAEEMSRAIAAGGPGAQAALQQTAQGILAIEDPAARANTAIALFGTPLEDLSVDQIPSFLSAIATVGPGMTDAAGSADALDKTLSTGIGPRLETFKRGLQTAATQGMQALIGGFTDGNTSAGGWQGTVQNLAASLSGTFGPALTAVAGFITNPVMPSLSGLFGFLAEHQTTVTVIAGLISGVLAAAFAVWGTRATVSAAQNVAAWFTTALSAQTGAASQQRSALQVVAGWVLMGAQALLNGLKVAAVWTAQIVASAVTGAASFAVSVAGVVAGWVVMGAQAFAQGLRVVAGWAVQGAAGLAAVAVQAVAVAGVVAGWVLMGVQSMIQAARMAAAWFIALGPVGWVIAAVIGLVALIVANWDTVVSWTTTAWAAVTGALGAAWDWIVGKVTGAASAVWGAIQDAWNTVTRVTGEAWEAVKAAVSAGIDAAVQFVSGLPGKAVSALGSLGSSIAGVATAAWDWYNRNVNTKVQEFLTYIGGLPGKAISALGDLGSSIAGVATAAWDWYNRNVNTKVQEFLTYVGGIPGKVISGLGNLGSLLVNAGKDLIDGLLDGIKSAWNSVKSLLGDLTDMLPDWKGPASRDRSILYGSGRLVMQGFEDGLTSKFGDVRGTLGSFTTELSPTVGIAADFATTAAGLGYRAPGYGTGAAAPAAAAGGDTYVTTINAAPTVPTEDQLAGVYRRNRLLAPRRR